MEDDFYWGNSNDWDYNDKTIRKQVEKKEKISKEKEISFIEAMKYFCFLLCFILLYNLICIIRVKTSNTMLKVDYNAEDYIVVKNKLAEEYIDIKCETPTKQEIIKSIHRETPLLFCIELESSNTGSMAGYCRFVIWTIVINNTLQIDVYAKALMHERLHLYYYTGCERFTQYQTFKHLYESKNEYLHKLGVQIALEIMNFRYPDDYDCTGQIIDYILKKGG